MELRLGIGGQGHRQVDGEHAEHADQNDGPQHLRTGQYVPDAVAQPAGRAGRESGAVQLPLIDHQQRGERGDVADRVDSEGVTGSDRVDQVSADRRSDQRAHLKNRRVQADRVPQLIRPDHLVHEGLPRRVVDGGHQAEPECDQVYVPRQNLLGQGQHGQDGGHAGHADLSQQQDLALVATVRDQATVHTEQQGGQELQGSRDAYGGRAPGDAQDQPVLCDALYPGAGVGHQLP
jgi:hypothetical protein